MQEPFEHGTWIVVQCVCAARQKLAHTVVPLMVKMNSSSSVELQMSSNHTKPAVWFPMDGHAFAIGTRFSLSSGSPYVIIRQGNTSHAQIFWTQPPLLKQRRVQVTGDFSE